MCVALYANRMSTCPTCSESFDTERGRNIHHTQFHGFVLDRLESEREWLLSRERDDNWDESELDSFVAQVEREIQSNKEKFGLSEQSKTIDLS